MGWKHDGDYQADGARADRGTHLFGRGARRLLRCRVAAVAHVIVSERVIIALLAAGPDAFQWAGSLVPFSTGPPTSTNKKNTFSQIAERHRRAGRVLGVMTTADLCQFGMPLVPPCGPTVQPRPAN